MKVTGSLKRRLAEVELLVFDVDGVLTPGQILYTDDGAEAKIFDVKDGLGIRVASSTNLKLAIMTGRSSRMVERRARDLRIPLVLQRVGDKAAGVRKLAESQQVPIERIAFMGDDLNDREAMRAAGLSFAPADAVEEIREEADAVTDAPGGRGAAREVVEAVLKSKEQWNRAVEDYLQDLGERDRLRSPE